MVTKLRIEELKPNEHINLIGGFFTISGTADENYEVYNIDDYFVIMYNHTPLGAHPVGVRHGMEEAMDLAYQEVKSRAEELKGSFKKAIIIDETSRAKLAKLSPMERETLKTFKCPGTITSTRIQVK